MPPSDRVRISWLEALAIALGLALFTQLAPNAAWAVVAALDIRNWGAGSLAVASVVALVMLVAMRMLQGER